MTEYIWLFPILFIFHDMEEIIGFVIWFNKNEKMLNERFPLISKIYHNFSTEGLALAVFEELIICILICVLTLLFHNNLVYYFWLGSFIACTLHFAIHIIQTLIIRKYIPAILTSVICLPISIYLITKVITILQVNCFNTIVYSLVGILLIATNLKFAHFLTRTFTKHFQLTDTSKYK